VTAATHEAGQRGQTGGKAGSYKVPADETVTPEIRMALLALPARERLFVEQLLLDPDFNLTRAAEKAGYRVRKEGSGHPTGIEQKVMDRPRVKKAVRLMVEYRARKNRIKADALLLEIAAIAFQNPKNLLKRNDKTGELTNELLDLKDMPDEVAATISSMKVTMGEMLEEGKPNADGSPGEPVFAKVKSIEMKFWSKMDGINLLARHLGLLKEMVVQDNRQFVQINWLDLLRVVDSGVTGSTADPIEQRIRQVEALADKTQPVQQPIQGASDDGGRVVSPWLAGAKENGEE
jgi:hypothetical protein